ncbi:TRAP transporter small permease [Xylophilus sp. GOD-11R]|uniref:TRAP transporter small permease n=1 Tax=Xylophilus sp. GOD-11R TaxID=3089814 RepID=UPI00298CAA32|nr:TRAP transporter small permease [Xylophilus sp. GOD-11R]WPB58910.1 TRAP transporter small permease [Xylophilus sp. GOD-11R]
MKRLQKLAELVLVAGLAGMVLMVFGNVVLRYGFSSGITFSEEVSRFLFVWITFLGAILAFAQRGHIAMETLTSRLPAPAQRGVAIASAFLMLGCCVLMVIGGWNQTLINLHNFAPVSGIPRGAIYAAAVTAGVCLGLLILRDLWRLLSGAPLHQFEQRSATE